MRTIDAHFKLAKRCDKQRALIPSCIKFCLSELKKASIIRLQNNKFSSEKNIRLKALIQ